MASKTYTGKAEVDPITATALLIIALVLAFVVYIIYELGVWLGNLHLPTTGFVGTILGWLGLSSPNGGGGGGGGGAQGDSPAPIAQGNDNPDPDMTGQSGQNGAPPAYSVDDLTDDY